jgi:NADH-quinone oxidoreductase subunit N
VVKIAALASLLRLATTSLAPIHEKWFYTLAAFSVITLFIGSLSAIYQNNFKRFLAYSGIANAGFLLIPIITISNTSSQTMLYYTLAYSLGTIAAFSAFIITKEYTDKYEIDSIRGLYKNNPLLTITIIVSMFSLAGIPPLAGFFAKYYLIMNAMEHKYYILAIIAIVASLIAIFYYLKIVTNIFSKESNIEKIPLSFADRSVLIICIISLIGLGLFPSLIFDLL